MTVTGTKFTTATIISFGSINAASTTFVSATEVAATVPTLATGTYNVTVTDPDPASATLNNGFTVTATQAQSFLSGCTVSASNEPSCSIPSGWTLTCAESFEGALGCGGQQELSGTVTTTNPHSGTHSLGGLYSSDGQVIADWIKEPAFGSYSDIYISYWNFYDSNATAPTDLELLHVSNCSQSTCPQTYQDEGWNVQGNIAKSTVCTNMTVAPNALGAGDQLTIIYTGNWCVNQGIWRQEEVWYHPNTVTNGAPNKDGFIKLYENGQLTHQLVNANLNGLRGSGTGNQTPTMQNPNPAAFIEVGGVITAFCDTAETTRANPFSLCPNAAPSSFHRYIDDVVVIKK